MRLVLPNIIFEERVVSRAGRLESLEGVRIGIADAWGTDNPDGSKGVYPTIAALVRSLERRYGATVSKWHLKKNVSDRVSDETMDELCADSDIIINGEGICGSCTAAAVLDGVEIQKRGKPSITVVEKNFEKAARLHARVAGCADLPLLVEPTPGTPEFDPDSFVESKMTQILEAFLVNPAAAIARLEASIQ